MTAMQRVQSASAGRAIESYPIRLFPVHMAEIFGVSMRRFYEMESRGEFIRMENRPAIGRKSWSRDRVAAYFAGANVHQLELVGRRAQVRTANNRVMASLSVAKFQWLVGITEHLLARQGVDPAVLSDSFVACHLSRGRTPEEIVTIAVGTRRHPDAHLGGIDA